MLEPAAAGLFETVIARMPDLPEVNDFSTRLYIYLSSRSRRALRPLDFVYAMLGAAECLPDALRGQVVSTLTTAAETENQILIALMRAYCQIRDYSSAAMIVRRLSAAFDPDKAGWLWDLRNIMASYPLLALQLSATELASLFDDHPRSIFALQRLVRKAFRLRAVDTNQPVRFARIFLQSAAHRGSVSFYVIARAVERHLKRLRPAEKTGELSASISCVERLLLRARIFVVWFVGVFEDLPEREYAACDRMGGKVLW